jgi:FdhD protein
VNPAQKPVAIVRVSGDERHDDSDRAATEEPMEVRLHGRPFAVIMRTPGADRELAAGFLFAERVLKSPDELGTIEHCRDEQAERAANVVNVTLTGSSLENLEGALAERRQTVTNASCGMCGRLTIDSLMTNLPALETTGRIPAATIRMMPERLRSAQHVFDETGGLHAAGLFDRDGALMAMAEDVGRHNAVDKVIGRMMMQDALPLVERLLFVSGRTSFEIVQKAFLAGIPLVASVSAPSSLAIELAGEAGITLVGFVRGDRFNIYTYPERIA